MKTVGVATLKSGLSRYLKTVQGGTELVVTAHRHAVAKLVPYAVAAGVGIRPPLQPGNQLSKLKGIQPLKPCDPLGVLLEDRARR